MKIRVVKKRGSFSVSFRAMNGGEGVDLKDVVLGMAKSHPDALVTDAVEELGKLGYTGELIKESPNVKEFSVKKA
jgi:hypothetical protein